MNKADARREEMLEKLADHVLAHGLQGASLRPLAAAAGTSDRMLLHYFANKEELLTAILTLVNRRQVAMLDAAQAKDIPFESLLHLLAGMLKDPQVQPYLRLWLELAALAAGGEEPHRTVARKIGDDFYTWIAAALHVEREEDRQPMASLALVTLEGLVLLDALGLDDNIAAALQGLELRR